MWHHCSVQDNSIIINRYSANCNRVLCYLKNTCRWNNKKETYIHYCRCTKLTITPSAAYMHQWTVSSSVIIGNGLSPIRRQVITWTNAGLLWIGLLGSFSEIWIGILSFPFQKMHLKMSSAKVAGILSRVWWVKSSYLNFIVSGGVAGCQADSFRFLPWRSSSVKMINSLWRVIGTGTYKFLKQNNLVVWAIIIQYLFCKAVCHPSTSQKDTLWQNAPRRF